MGVAVFKKCYFLGGVAAGGAAAAGFAAAGGAAAGGFAAGGAAAAGGFAAGDGAAGGGAWAKATPETNPNTKIDNNLFIYISYLGEISLHG